MMRVLIIPDVHGLSFWKEPVNRYINEVDRMVFLGDYLDPYPDKGESVDTDDIFGNLVEIIKLKHEHKEKVVLLIGNHDYHYFSKRALQAVCASRCDLLNWRRYNEFFVENENEFCVAHMEKVKDVTYLFSHAGLTTYWINKVNHVLWKMNDRDISVANQDIIDRINQLPYDYEGQNMLFVVGKQRSLLGEKTGSVLWADIYEHSIPYAQKVYGLDKVFQVIGHTMIDDRKGDMVAFDNLALIDSRQCFIISDDCDKKITTLREYEIEHEK